jgi:hypothetical protein
MLSQSIILRSIKRLLFVFSILCVIDSCVLFEKEESCLYHEIQPPYSNVKLIICNDGTRIDTKTYSSTACDGHDGIEGVYECTPI